jgi:hypothetical protein
MAAGQHLMSFRMAGKHGWQPEGQAAQHLTCLLRCSGTLYAEHLTWLGGAGGTPGSFWEYQGRQLADWDSEGASEEDPALQEALARSLRT